MSSFATSRPDTWAPGCFVPLCRCLLTSSCVCVCVWLIVSHPSSPAGPTLNCLCVFYSCVCVCVCGPAPHPSVLRWHITVNEWYLCSACMSGGRTREAKTSPPQSPHLQPPHFLCHSLACFAFSEFPQLSLRPKTVHLLFFHLELKVSYLCTEWGFYYYPQTTLWVM